MDSLLELDAAVGGFLGDCLLTFGRHSSTVIAGGVDVDIVDSITALAIDRLNGRQETRMFSAQRCDLFLSFKSDSRQLSSVARLNQALVT